jgi:hypothetical protein
MTLIVSSKDVDRLIGEMRCWGPDPDLRRIADALPLEVLEAAYVAKLSQLPLEDLPEQAGIVQQKVSVLRRILAAWLRQPEQRLGQLFANTVTLSLFYIPDDRLAREFSRAYTSPK